MPKGEGTGQAEAAWKGSCIILGEEALKCEGRGSKASGILKLIGSLTPDTMVMKNIPKFSLYFPLVFLENKTDIH